MSYWTQKNKKDLEDFEFLEKEYEGTKVSAYDFLHGLCTFFAYFYVKKYGGIIVSVFNYTNYLIHSYVEIEKDNEKYYIDIRGKISSEAQLLDEFGLSYEDKNGNYEYYKNIDDYHSWIYYSTPKELRYFYNRFIKGDEKYLLDAEKFIEANLKFYL